LFPFCANKTNQVVDLQLIAIFVMYLEPHHLLAKLYHRTGNEIAFNKKAQEILHFVPRKPNGEVFFMKEEIKNVKIS